MSGADFPADYRRKAAAVFAAAAALAAYPPAYVALRMGERGVAAAVTGDALLYLTIARNSHGGFFSYDGTTATNGFHPLWQFYLSAVIPHGTPPGSLTPFWIAFWSSLVAVSIGAGLAALAIMRYTRSPLLAMLTVPGVYYMVCGSLFSNLPIWASVSGMEAGFSTLFGGLLLYVMARAVTDPRGRFEAEPYAARGPFTPWLWMGLVLPFVVLSRLDDVFLVAGLAAVIAVLHRRQAPLRARAVAAAQLCGPTAVAVGAYMAYNLSYAGTPLPVSGQTKAGLVLGKNLYVTLAGIFPPLMDLKNALAAKQSVASSVFANSFRWAELLVPALIGCAYIAWALVSSGRTSATTAAAATPARGAGAIVRGAPPAPLRYALPAGIAAGVALKALYNLANVHYWHQAGWYYAFAVVAVSFLVAVPLGPVAARVAATPVLRRVVPAAYLLYVFMAASRAIAGSAAAADGNVEYDYLADRDQIAAKLREGRRDVKLLAFDDGATGYNLPFPTIHGFGFAADLATARALRDQHLLRHAWERGHNILTSAVYFPANAPLPTPDDARAFLRASMLEERVKNELDQFDFRLVYVDERTHAPFFEFAPRGAAARGTSAGNP
jgi:hypothetical protein